MKKNGKQINYRKEPPDGGWGYLVCTGLALSFISPLASMPSFGLIFGEFLMGLGEETSAIAVITSAFFSTMSFAGLFSNTLFKKFSLKTVGLVGGIIYFLGSLMQIFVQSTSQLLVTFSILQGGAFGLMVPAAYSCFNEYFVKRRVMMMSLAQAMIGVGTMLYPILVQKLLEWYGFRGCLAVLAALNGHTIVGMLVMHPVKWHMKKVMISEEVQLDYVTKELPLAKNHQQRKQSQPLLVDSNESISKKASIKLAKSLDCTKINSVNVQVNASRRASTNPSIGNWTGSLSINECVARKSKPRSIWEKVVEFLDLTLFKMPIYVNIVLGMSFALYSDLAFFTLQPLYLFELGFPKAETASIIAFGAAADLLSRVFLGFCSAFVTMPSRYIYLAGAFFTVIARFAFLTVYDFLGMSIITAVLGFLRTWLHVPLPLVIAEYLPKERFASGYGLFMFLQGNIMFLIGPFVGYIRDITHSYVTTFHCLNFFMAACAIPWLIEIFWLKYWKESKKNPVG